MPRGRDPLPENKKRKKRSLSFSDDEYQRLGELADKANMNKSKFVRRVVFKEKITAKTDMETANELNSIGVNLNQIAKVMNKTGRPVAEEKLINLCDRIFNTICELR